MDLLASEIIVHILSFSNDIRDVLNFGSTCSFYRSVILKNAKALPKSFSNNITKTSGIVNALGEARVVSYNLVCPPDREEGLLVKGVRQGVWTFFSDVARVKTLMKDGCVVYSHKILKGCEEIVINGKVYSKGPSSELVCINTKQREPAFFRLGSHKLDFLLHCCKGHQKEMPDSLFSKDERKLLRKELRYRVK